MFWQWPLSRDYWEKNGGDHHQNSLVNRDLTIETKRPVNQMAVPEKNEIIFKYILSDRFGRCISFLTTPCRLGLNYGLELSGQGNI